MADRSYCEAGSAESPLPVAKVSAAGRIVPPAGGCHCSKSPSSWCVRPVIFGEANTTLPAASNRSGRMASLAALFVSSNAGPSGPSAGTSRNASSIRSAPIRPKRCASITGSPLKSSTGWPLRLVSSTGNGVPAADFHDTSTTRSRRSRSGTARSQPGPAIDSSPTALGDSSSGIWYSMNGA